MCVFSLQREKFTEERDVMGENNKLCVVRNEFSEEVVGNVVLK